MSDVSYLCCVCLEATRPLVSVLLSPLAVPPPAAVGSCTRAVLAPHTLGGGHLGQPDHQGEGQQAPTPHPTTHQRIED